MREVFCAALSCAQAQGVRELILCDTDFAEWPLGERDLAQLLHSWSRAGGRASLLALDYRPLQARQPRWVEWRRQWSHAIEVRRGLQASASGWPSAMWSPAGCLERPTGDHSPWLGSTRPERIAALRQRLQALWDQAVPAFPATTLGL